MTTPSVPRAGKEDLLIRKRTETFQLLAYVVEHLSQQIYSGSMELKIFKVLKRTEMLQKCINQTSMLKFKLGLALILL